MTNDDEMVGIVVVSHSRPLARAAVSLAQQMLHGRPVPIVIAAGLDEATLGTDAHQILQAIGAAQHGSGVVVLMDLGSAVLSAELALDLLDGPDRARVLLCPAPLVEGLIVASVAAAGGATMETVAAEATAALAGKAAHLGHPLALLEHVEEEQEGLPSETLSGSFALVNAHGLHARPAARLAHEIRSLDAKVQVRNRTTGSSWVSASSLSKVTALGALRGHEVEVRTRGHQAREALNHVLILAARGFDEEHDRPVDEDPRATGATGHGRDVASGALSSHPLPGSPGIGIAPAWRTTAAPVDVPATRTDDPDGEWRRLQQAIVTARGEVQRTRARVARKVGATEAAIFDAHLLLLEDTDLLGEVRALLDDGLAAAPAWAQTINRISDEIAALPDEYLRTRAQDVCAVGDQVIQALIGGHTGTLGAAGVVVAPDMTPAEAADLDQRQVAAVLLAFGSPTSHSTILLRAKGIPAVVAAGPAVLDIAHGTSTAVDGTRGEFVVNPSTDVRAAWQARAADLARREQRALTGADSPAATRDGIDILVGANIGSLDDAHSASTTGADLAGLVRTEFLFLNRAQAPTVDEQETVYRDIAKALDGRRITLRTLDVGGDKPLDYLPLPFEANPFLGVRGIRLSLAHPRLFADQLLAIVRVAHNTPVSLMFPMISTLDELIRAQTVLDDAISVDGRGRPDDLRVGIMVEVPAAALKAAVFTPHIDFLSIGTNDLTQYTLAAERGNAAVADTCDPLDPAVLRLIDVACRGAAGRVPVAVCGELAAAELVTPLLLGLGVRQLSVAPRAVPTIKHAARAVDITETAELVTQSIHLESAAAVRRLLDAAPARPCWLI